MTDAWHNKWLIHHDWLSVITEVFSLNIDFGSTGPFFLDFFPTSMWKKKMQNRVLTNRSASRGSVICLAIFILSFCDQVATGEWEFEAGSVTLLFFITLPVKVSFKEIFWWRANTNTTMEVMFMGINMFWVRLGVILARVCMSRYF